MADIKLFATSGSIREIQSKSVGLEKELQTLIERNMETFFGVKFLASEYQTTNGRIDSLGIDENKCPIIFEYKRSISENVINQGLFYLDWLLEHKDAFYILVMKNCNKEMADLIDWSMPRLICVANDFTRYDEFAVKQINKNISLIRYKVFEQNLLMFEQLNANVVNNERKEIQNRTSVDQSFDKAYSSANKSMQNLYCTIKDYIMSLGDDITENKLMLYVAFKKIKNIASVRVHTDKITIWLNLDGQIASQYSTFARDVTNIGHWSSGNLEITIKNQNDFEKAKGLILRSYNEG